MKHGDHAGQMCLTLAAVPLFCLWVQGAVKTRGALMFEVPGLEDRCGTADPHILVLLLFGSTSLEVGDVNLQGIVF